MPETLIGSATASDLTNTQTDFSVDTQETDGATNQKETTYMNTDWSQQHGYYRQVPELRAAIDAKATWTVGKGVKADDATKLILDRITGFGKDTFNTIIENMIRVMMIGGDSFAEQIRDEDNNLINLKPLDPGVMEIVANPKGIITKYKQKSKVKSPDKVFRTDQILHFSRNRVADEIHGVSIIEALTVNILARNEAIADMKTLMHRHVKPMRVWHLDTDDDTEIAKFKSTIDNATNKGENIYLPKGTVEQEIASVPPNATLNPLPWITWLTQEFYRATGGTDIVLGGSGEFTEATAKIKYLAFQQNVEEDQLYIEEQVGLQLGLLIELEFPASLENELLSDKAKDNEQGAAQPTDTTASLPGIT